MKFRKVGSSRWANGHLVSLASTPFPGLSCRRSLSFTSKVLLTFLFFLTELFLLAQLLFFLLAQIILIIILAEIFLLRTCRKLPPLPTSSPGVKKDSTTYPTSNPCHISDSSGIPFLNCMFTSLQPTAKHYLKMKSAGKLCNCKH